MNFKPCVTQLNEKPTEASNRQEKQEEERKFANVRLSQLKAERAKQMKIIQGIKETVTI